MSKEIRNNILKYLNDGFRFDGRKQDEFRLIEIESGIINTCEGSARVKIGQTEVIAGVKLDVGTPFSDTPDRGALMVNLELLPMSSPEFEPGPPSINAIEISRVIDRGIRESGAIDYKKLCITKGEKVWIVSIDICSINDDGNLMDASGIAAIAALKIAKFPEYDGEKVDYKKPTKDNLPLLKIPIPITVYKLDDKLFVDPSVDEEKVYDARLTITTTEEETLCALQKGGELPLKPEEIVEMLKIAKNKAKEIRKKLD